MTRRCQITVQISFACLSDAAAGTIYYIAGYPTFINIILQHKMANVFTDLQWRLRTDEQTDAGTRVHYQPMI